MWVVLLQPTQRPSVRHFQSQCCLEIPGIRQSKIIILQKYKIIKVKSCVNWTNEKVFTLLVFEQINKSRLKFKPMNKTLRLSNPCNILTVHFPYHLAITFRIWVGHKKFQRLIWNIFAKQTKYKYKQGWQHL